MVMAWLTTGRRQVKDAGLHHQAGNAQVGNQHATKKNAATGNSMPALLSHASI